MTGNVFGPKKVFMAKTKRIGRPPLPKSERKGEQIKIVVTKEQRRTLEAAAERNERTLSDWIRLVALRAAEEK